jgi:hypothetical protein
MGMVTGVQHPRDPLTGPPHLPDLPDLTSLLLQQDLLRQQDHQHPIFQTGQIHPEAVTGAAAEVTAEAVTEEEAAA